MTEDTHTPAPSEPVAGPVQRPVRPLARELADHIEHRMRAWRQQHMNRSGDRLALDDFMGEDSIADLIDFVCDEYAMPAQTPLTHMQIVMLWGHRSDGPSTPELVSFARLLERHHGIGA